MSDATATEETTETPAESEVDQHTYPDGTTADQLVKPVALAKELGIKPQIVYGWVRNGNLPHYRDEKGITVIVRSEFAEWQEARKERKAAREAKKAETEAKA